MKTSIALRSAAPWIILLLLFGCGTSSTKEPEDPTTMAWPEVEAAARGQTIYLMMWQGDPYINRYLSEYVVPTLRERHDVDLQLVSGQGSQIVSTLMAELEAGRAESEIDMMWINGETFYQLRQIEALHGPFLSQLPHAEYLALDDPFIATDFQQPIDGYECPWGNVQLSLIYDSSRVADPPRTLAALKAYVQANPGKFTIANEFTGMTLLKSWLMALAGGSEPLSGEFDEEKYERYSQQLWAYLNEIKPYLWRQGQTFPAQLSQLHQMFASGEVDFTMSNNDGEVDNKVRQGLFPSSARAFVFETGTIRNSHYLGIAKRSARKAAALVACNFMISPEAQLRKLLPDVWGDGTVLDVEKLPAEWQEQFAALPPRRHAPPRAALRAQALPELAPMYMIRLYEDFRTEVIDP